MEIVFFAFGSLSILEVLTLITENAQTYPECFYSSKDSYSLEAVSNGKV
jgi:hypothetical protein